MLLLFIFAAIVIAAVAVMVVRRPSTFLFDLIERTFTYELPEQRR